MSDYFLFPSTQPAFEGRPLRLALFDVDGTLITSKCGRRWATDGDDWIFLGDVPRVLQEYATAGWTVALVSNQSEWKRGPGPRAKISSVLDALFAANAWAPWCLVATGKSTEGVYRKPARGLYDVLLKELGNPAVAEVKMCGDAVGAGSDRPEYRWADSDAAFAAAIRATFVTPEEVFGRRAATAAAGAAGKEVVILVGNMGSGKSTTAAQLLAAGYTHAEQDVLKTPAAMRRTVRNGLMAGASVVVDATHATADSRAPYISLAREHGASVRILWHIRDGRPYNALRPSPVPEVAYAMYSKRFEDPRFDGVQVETIY